jgi:polyisoprenoid-binding protein YceI
MGTPTGVALRGLLEDGTLAGEWVLDSRRSSIQLSSKSLGVIPVKGVFHDVSGHGTVSPDGSVSGTLLLKSASIDTGNPKRDAHLRSGEIFDSGNHPQITFTVNGIRPAGTGVAVTGALTVRGRTRPLSFDATASVSDSGEICLDAETRVNRTGFDVTWKGSSLISKISVMRIHAVFVRTVLADTASLVPGTTKRSKMAP